MCTGIFPTFNTPSIAAEWTCNMQFSVMSLPIAEPHKLLQTVCMQRPCVMQTLLDSLKARYPSEGLRLTSPLRLASWPDDYLSIINPLDHSFEVARFGRRTELAAGKYAVVVLGYAVETQFELTVQLVEQQRSLRPAATLALGQVRCTPSSSKSPRKQRGSLEVNGKRKYGDLR